MWKHVALPTVTIACVWLIVTTGTSYYLSWTEDTYQRNLSENVSTLNALTRLTERLLRYSVTPAEHIHDLTAEIHTELNTIDATAQSSEEKQAATELRSQIRPYLTDFDSSNDESSRAPMLRQITDTTQVLQRINENCLKAGDEQRKRIWFYVFWLRIIVTLLATGLGVTYGLWVAGRLRTAVHQIQGTLRKASPTTEELVSRSDEFHRIQHQITSIVDHLVATRTELTQAQAEVIRADRLISIGTLASGVAHELRNPLTSIKLLLQNAQHNGPDALSPSHLQLILDEIQRMEGVIQGLLDFSRPPTPRRIRHDLRHTIVRSLSLVAGRAKNHAVDLRIDIDDEPVWYDGDPDLLHQVFVNVFINAIEAMPTGGQVVVKCSRSETPPRLVLSITDTGPGIASEILPQLFEPFVTTKDHGTGLGLAVSRRIIESHGGAMTAANCAGHGAQMLISLPTADRPSFAHSPDSFDQQANYANALNH